MKKHTGQLHSVLYFFQEDLIRIEFAANVDGSFRNIKK